MAVLYLTRCKYIEKFSNTKNILGIFSIQIKKSMVKERIKLFCETEHITISSFEKKIGVANGYVNSISKSIGIDKLVKLLEIFPNMNIEWLLTGTGEMYKSKTSNEQSERKDLLKEINDREEIIRKQAEQIGALKAELSLKAKTASPAHDLQAAAAV